MPGLKLYTSNRLEILVEKLAEIIKEPLASPLDKEVVVVQSKGMERWVSMEMARCHGICANFRFPFPNAFIQEVFAAALGDLPDPSPFDPQVMTWKVMKLLPSCIEEPRFEGPRSYLADDPSHLKRFQLAQRVAGLFDQYLLYRPDMVLEWEKGREGQGSSQESHWQSRLWREISRGRESLHRPALRDAFRKAVRGPLTERLNLPARVAVFGISSLPPFHMELFAELSRFTHVNLFLMNPCREYWADIKSDREISRIAGKSSRKDIPPEALYLEKGNNLLSSMGALGRDFFRMIQLHVEDEEDLFDEPGEACLLHCIQSDILNLGDRGPQDKTGLSPSDRSIVFHSCHGPMREMEVLYDQVLALLEEEPDLSPRDILVMAPDIDEYAPFVQAVFDSPEDPALRVPFSITDRSIRKESHIIEGFLAILDLPGSRFEASRVLALLESATLRRRFDLSPTDVDLIRRWVSEVSIRWGIDGESRARMGFEEFSENSWRAGLDRLLLGSAMPGGGERLFHSILPYDHIEGSEAAVLGKLLDFVRRLFSDVAGLARPRTLTEWARTLTGLMDRFFEPDPASEREAQAIRRTLNDLSRNEELSGLDDDIGLEVIKSYLSHRLETESPGLGFITGGVTFCAMLPMRSIPFEVICLVGMDDGAFPRQTRSLGFDLMAKAPRVGDRSQRNDDRYLFLEALLSARRRLYISYVGQSTEDNSTMPPSVPVSELMDAVDRGFRISGSGASALEHITTRHRLQPFSTQYFSGRDFSTHDSNAHDLNAHDLNAHDSSTHDLDAHDLNGRDLSGHDFSDSKARYFSYSHENCLAAAACGTARKEPEPLITSGLGEPEEEWRTVDLDRLGLFFANPARLLLSQRLRMQLSSRDLVLEDREAFGIEGLERYLIEEEMLERLLSSRMTADYPDVLRASGRLPHGTVGQCGFEVLTREVKRFWARIEHFCRAPALPPGEVALDLPPFRIIGRIDGLTALGLVRVRSAKIKARDRLSLWIRHLVLNAMGPADHPPTSILLGTDSALELQPVDDARSAIERLLALYWKGLMGPIRFFPQSSHAYARAILDGKPEEVALKAARREWEGDRFKSAERDEPHLALCFGERDALDAEFQRLALEVFEPLLEHEKPLR